MKRFLCVFAAAAVLAAATEGRAQFFDDFDGDDLAPHWSSPLAPPEFQHLVWAHRVEGGLLWVDDLLFPSSGGSNTNYQYLDTFIPPVFGDFTAIAVMGLTAGSHRSISMRLSGTQAGGLGDFIYNENGVVGIGVGGTTVLPTTLDPGLHEFKMVRTGAQISYFLDNVHLGTLANSNVDQGAYWLRLQFDVSYPAGLPMAPMLVDHVSVVPAPASTTVVLMALALSSRKRRN
ncbi:MAG: hypothetical protein KF699_03300 [Phycisphaeraceae bacterium]|nr:hypothetical protein [Phycisphaeraceae bacterium]MBX3405534.1 hypothetical protein [Phycisphaeraceae bacterium]